jgi:ribosomal protein S24E
MEIEILSKKENRLVDRIELAIVAKHQGAPTPKREEVRDLVAVAMKAEKDRVIVDWLDTRYGTGVTKGYVKVYPTKQRALDVEERPILVRNKLAAPKPKAEKKAAAPPPSKAKAEAKAKAESKPESKVAPKADAKAESKPESKAAPKADAKAESKPESKAAPKADAKAESKADAKKET